MANEQINANIATSKLRAVFVDNTAIAARIKAAKGPKGEVEKEGQIEIIFLDMLTQQPVGRFVMGKMTAKELVTGLSQNIAKMEKEVASKELPKQPSSSSIEPSSSTTYR
jgi:hypothetical protein